MTFTSILGSQGAQPGLIELGHLPEEPTSDRWQNTGTTDRWAIHIGDRWPLTPTTTRWP